MTTTTFDFDGPGVMTSTDTPTPTLVSSLDNEGETLTVTLADGSQMEYPSGDISTDEKTGRLTIASGGATYTVRPLRETDGVWLSKYKTVLPYEALENLSERREDATDMEASETLYAYALDDSPYVIGLGYSDGDHLYSRTDGDWVDLGDDDESISPFATEGMIAIPIDPARADEYIKLYDENFVTVTDTEDFEAPESK